MSEERRAPSPIAAEVLAKVDHMHECMETVKTSQAALTAEVAENTKVTKEIHDILVAFRMFGMFAKWATGIVAFATSLYVMWKTFKGA